MVTARDVKMSVWAFRGASVQEVRSTFRQLESMGYGDCMGEGLHLKFAAKQKNVDAASNQKPNQTVNVDNRDHSQSDSNVAYNINVERFNQGDSTSAE